MSINELIEKYGRENLLGKKVENNKGIGTIVIVHKSKSLIQIYYEKKFSGGVHNGFFDDVGDEEYNWREYIQSVGFVYKNYPSEIKRIKRMWNYSSSDCLDLLSDELAFWDEVMDNNLY